MSAETMSIKEFMNYTKSKSKAKYIRSYCFGGFTAMSLGTSMGTALALPLIGDVTDWIIDLFKTLLIKSIDGLCFICILVVGLSILAYVIDNKSFSPKKYMTGGFVVYFGLRIIEYLLT